MEEFKAVMCQGMCGKKFKVHKSTPTGYALLYCRKCGEKHSADERAKNHSRDFAFKIDDIVVAHRYTTWEDGQWVFHKRTNSGEPILTQFKITSANSIYGGHSYFARDIDNKHVQISSGDILFKL